MNVEGHCFDLTVREDTAIRWVLMALREVSGDCEFIVNVEFLQCGCVCVCVCACAFAEAPGVRLRKGRRWGELAGPFRNRGAPECGCAKADSGGAGVAVAW